MLGFGIAPAKGTGFDFVYSSDGPGAFCGRFCTGEKEYLKELLARSEKRILLLAVESCTCCANVG